EDDNEASRKSKRQRVEKSFGNDFIVYLVDDTPTSISEAYASPDVELWKEPVQSELDSILSNGTWELTERPYGCKPVGYKWVFKRKRSPDGTIEKYKARLAAKGYTKKEGKDFFDTYSPIARMTIIHVLLSPVVSYGFTVNEADSCIYYHYGGGKGVILCLYIDDILIFGTDIDVINEVKSFSTKFDMKDLGEADVILNIKLIKDERGLLFLKPLQKVLSRFGYIDNKPSLTPYDPNVTLKKNKRIGVNQIKYSQIIGSLMYLASATRPDISFAVSKLSRFMSNPGTNHWQALERVMCYLKGTMSYGIHYSEHPAVLEGYSDAN
ncbi:LOW QUALITY PROTEIN: hypothetical protein U9M48_000399, partial [Paspalum notatum var. saurae]